MNFTEQFLISLMSKRARNTLKLTSVLSHFTLNFDYDFSIYLHHYWQNPQTVKTEESCCIGGKEMRLKFRPNTVILQEQSVEKRILLTNHVLDTFKKPIISLEFSDPTLPSTALEIMKMINKRQPCIKSFTYHINSPSSEFIPRIMDECTEVTDSISIYSLFPDDFVYTPSRPFRAD
uniref:FTH domain-containing protein n=1 Tax=Caenorhabditis tropicalis TaxID=1561998 RepID=A0A1I7UTP9_9PELO